MIDVLLGVGVVVVILLVAGYETTLPRVRRLNAPAHPPPPPPPGPTR